MVPEMGASVALNHLEVAGLRLARAIRNGDMAGSPVLNARKEAWSAALLGAACAQGGPALMLKLALREELPRGGANESASTADSGTRGASSYCVRLGLLLPVLTQWSSFNGYARGTLVGES